MVEPKKWTDAFLEWMMDYLEVDRDGAIAITKCDDGTALQWAFNAGMEYEREQRRIEATEELIGRIDNILASKPTRLT